MYFGVWALISVKSLEMPVLVSDVVFVCHVYVALADGLTFNSSKMNRLLLWVVLDHLDDRAIKWASVPSQAAHAAAYPYYILLSPGP